MNLNEAWDKLGQDSATQQPEPDMDAILKRGQHSQSIVSTLRRGLMIKLMWVVLFIVVLTMLIIITWGGPKAYVLMALLAFMMLGIAFIYPRYRQLPATTDPANPSLQVLKLVREQVAEAIRMETNLGKWFMPMFPIGGMLLAFPDDRLSWTNISANPGKAILLVIAAIGIGYLANKLGEKMNNYAFGKDLKRLDEVIHDLEEE